VEKTGTFCQFCSSLRPTKTAAHLPSGSAALAARSPARTLTHHQTWPRDRDPNPRDEQQRSGKRGHAINLCTEGASVRVQRRCMHTIAFHTVAGPGPNTGMGAAHMHPWLPIRCSNAGLFDMMHAVLQEMNRALCSNGFHQSRPLY
jgi:hypothetical protein